MHEESKSKNNNNNNIESEQHLRTSAVLVRRLRFISWIGLLVQSIDGFKLNVKIKCSLWIYIVY